MKSIPNILLAFLLVLAIPSLAANPSKKVNSKITEVLVYRQFAKVTNIASISVQPGTTEIVLDEISTSINPQSLQVAIKGGITLLSAVYNVNYLNESGHPVRNQKLQDSLEWVGDELTWNQQQKNVYTGEMALLEANKSLVNEKNNFTPAEVTNLANMYRQRMLELNEKMLDLTKKQRKLALIKIGIESQIAEWSANLSKANGQIILTVSADAPVSGAIRCSYIVSNAGWNPIYDLRSEGWNKPIQLGYKANIYQKTGYDWNDVNVTVSTGNPAKNNNRPILNPLYVDYVVYRAVTYGYSAPSVASGNMAYMKMEKAAADDDKKDEKFEETGKVESTMTSNFMNVEYKLKINQDIAADGKEHMVAIDQFNLPAIYQYQSVPKLDPAAFLLAKVTDYGKYNLIPGNANIFFEGAYVGQSYIDPTIAGDTLLLSLGKDEQIAVKRIKLNDFSKTKIISTNKSETYAFETTIKNNKSTDINIEVLDQVPISKSDDIKVEIEEMNGADYIADYGKLTWMINIPANSTKKIKLIYTVKYPKDKTIEETN
jgi:uncharacterized protein (TIGR02231 family)